MSIPPKKPSVADIVAAQACREIPIVRVVQPEELKEFEHKKTKLRSFNKMARFDSPMNMFDVMLTLTKPEQRILSEMSHAAVWPDYVADLDFRNLTPNQKREKYKPIRALIRKALICRVDVGKYMFNPDFIPLARKQEDTAARMEWIHHVSP